MGAYQAVTSAVAGLLGIFAPGAALGYARRRSELARACGYEAARLDGPNGRYLPMDGNINARNAKDRRTIQARARQLVDDNPNVSGALEKIIANVIYTGIRPQAQITGRDGKLFEAANNAVERDFADWARRQQWRALLETALRHCWMDGGCLLHWYPRRDFLVDGLTPLGLELLDLDSLDQGVHGVQPDGNRAWYGIEINRYGEPVAYHVREEALDGGLDGLGIAPGSNGAPVWSLGESVRLPASNCRIIMRRKRIGQLLPVSWMHSIITTMHDLNEYQSAERIAARLAAAFGIFVILPEGQGGNDLNGKPIPALSGGTDTLDRIISGKEFISQGRIDALPAGARIEQAKNERPGGNYQPFVKNTQRSASSGLNMSCEAFSNDYSDASFSSVRQAVLEERRGYRMQQSFLLEQVCEPFWEVWCRFRALFLRGDERVPARWQCAGWSWVDPQKDANAAKTRLDMGIVSRRVLCEEQGLDYDEIKAQIAAEAADEPRAALPPARKQGDDNGSDSSAPRA